VFTVTLANSSAISELVTSRYFQLPWAGESAGHDTAPQFRWHAGAAASKNWVYTVKGARPDPGGDGVVGRGSRVALDWFPLNHEDGLNPASPLLSSITSLAVTTFPLRTLPALIAEIDAILPHLTDADAAFFNGLAFLAEEALREGQGEIVFTPL